MRQANDCTGHSLDFPLFWLQATVMHTVELDLEFVLDYAGIAYTRVKKTIVFQRYFPENSDFFLKSGNFLNSVHFKNV